MVLALLTAAAAFGFGFLGSMPLTGPVAVLVVSRCALREYGAAVRIALGAAAAEALYAGLAYLGFTTFLARHPLVLPISHGFSAVVLGALGFYFLRWRVPSGRAPEHARKRLRQGAALGFTVSALNPTLLATWAAAVAVLYARRWFTFSQPLAIPFGLAAGGGVAAWELCFIALLRRFEARFPRRALTRLVRAMGLLLLLAGVWSAVSFVRVLAGGVGR